MPEENLASAAELIEMLRRHATVMDGVKSCTELYEETQKELYGRTVDMEESARKICLAALGNAYGERRISISDERFAHISFDIRSGAKISFIDLEKP